MSVTAYVPPQLFPAWPGSDIHPHLPTLAPMFAVCSIASSSSAMLTSMVEVSPSTEPERRRVSVAGWKASEERSSECASE